jgi:hypothetical protein
MASNKSVETGSKERNAFVFGLSPQAELWNGRLAMLVTTYLLFKHVFHLI